MDILYILVPISILLVFFAGLLFWWALNNRQFDELDDVSERILKDTDTPPIQSDDHAKLMHNKK